MPGSFILLLLLLLSVGYGQLISSDSNQALIDQILQVIWEPSSLIRMWVGLDQLFNIVRSWRGVAKKLTSLPFGGDGETHVRIQEPRSMMYHKPSVGSQLDRFNQMYASSSLSPIVGHAGSYASALASNLHPVKARPSPNAVRMPPPFAFHSQEVFLNSDWIEFFQKMGGLDYSSLFGRHIKPFSDVEHYNGFGYPVQLKSLADSQNGNRLGFPSHFKPADRLAYPNHRNNVNNPRDLVPFGFSNSLAHSFNREGDARAKPFSNLQGMSFDNRIPSDAGKLANLQKQENGDTLLNQKYSNSIRYPTVVKDDNFMMKMTPQERLNMFLLLMKTLGNMNTKKMSDFQSHTNYPKSMNRNDVAPFHISNFVDRGVLETSDRK